jgi:hypothetical protein
MITEAEKLQDGHLQSSGPEMLVSAQSNKLEVSEQE